MERRKQATLGAFGFTKKVCHRGEEKTIAIPSTPTEEPRLSCVKCRSTFKNQQGLTVHMKCKHPGVSEDDVDFIEESTTVVQSALSMFQQPTKDTSIEITEKAQPPAIQPLAKPQPGPSRSLLFCSLVVCFVIFAFNDISFIEFFEFQPALFLKLFLFFGLISAWCFL